MHRRAGSFGKKKVSASELGTKLARRLGISSDQVETNEPRKRKPKRPLTRKEKRQHERVEKKQKKVVSRAPVEEEPKRKFETGLLSAAQSKRNRSNESNAKTMKPHEQSKTSRTLPSFEEVDEDPEDIEIRRLEKLLGVGKSAREKAAEKLNREYKMFEGISGGFGSFLMGLDNIGTKSACNRSHWD